MQHAIWFLLAIWVIFLSAPVIADGLGYNEVHTDSVANSQYLVIHYHDWSDRTREKRIEMISGNQNPFTADNDFAYIESHRVGTDSLMFRSPCPALSYLYISPDSKFIVGLSDIQLWNPCQLVVFDTTGRLLFAKHISSQVAGLTAAQFDTLVAANASRADLLRRQSLVRNDSFYVDFMFMDAPRRFGDTLWHTLLTYACASPYSPNFSESVTNWVWWYCKDDPITACVEKDGFLTGIEMKDNACDSMFIPVDSTWTP